MLISLARQYWMFCVFIYLAIGIVWLWVRYRTERLGIGRVTASLIILFWPFGVNRELKNSIRTKYQIDIDFLELFLGVIWTIFTVRMMLAGLLVRALYVGFWNYMGIITIFTVVYMLVVFNPLFDLVVSLKRKS